MGALTILAGASRRAFLAWPDRPKTCQLPPEYIVILGLLFTVVTALVYLPVYVALESGGRDFVDRRHPLDDDAAPSSDWYGDRTRLEQFLQVGVRAGESLQSGVAILAPLTASLVSVALPK